MVKQTVTRRNSGEDHRTAVVSADVVILPTLATTADVATGGSLVKGTSYKTTVAPGNTFGSGGATNILTQATASDGNDTHCVDLTVPAVTGATYFDVFLSTDAQPLWVARVTETQRAAGAKVTAVGTVTSPASGVTAGKVRITVVGTGIATNVAPFTVNNALIIPSGVTAISCDRFNKAIIHFEATVTDFRATPSVTWVPVFLSKDGGWYSGGVVTLNIDGAALGKTLKQTYPLDVDGALGLEVLFGSLTGQGLSMNVWVELS